jgi:hypothetical protein
MVRALAVGVVALLTGCAPALAASGQVHATHTVTVAGELVNHWTIDEPGDCGIVGDGTLTVKFQTTQIARVLPYIDKFASSETGHFGSWIIGTPLPPHAIKDRGWIKASGTITRVDNTAPRPSSDGSPCDPVDKQGCGELPLKLHGGVPKAVPGRYDKRRISVDLVADDFEFPRKPCGSGTLTGWSDFRFVGGDRESGVLRITMPRESRLKRRRVVRVTGSDHKRRGGNDVTRRATVTFKKL